MPVRSGKYYQMASAAPKYFSMERKNCNLMLKFRVFSLGLLQAVSQEHEVLSQRLVKCHCGPCMSPRAVTFPCYFRCSLLPDRLFRYSRITLLSWFPVQGLFGLGHKNLFLSVTASFCQFLYPWKPASIGQVSITTGWAKKNAMIPLLGAHFYCSFLCTSSLVWKKKKNQALSRTWGCFIKA